jgi:predicted secreted Zn-dependent protease
MTIAGVFAQGVDASPSAEATAAGFHVIHHKDILTIEAVDRTELARALIGLRRTQGWHGQTALSFEQRAELVPDRAGCRLEGLRTTLVVTVTLPRLDRRGARDDPAFERLWQASVAGLRLHEEGHVAIGIEGARIAHDRISAAGPFADCREARRVLMREEFRFRHHQAAAHQRYDRRTASGARQGAVIPAP